MRRSVATDTPLPPDEPVAPNPPDGAVLDFRLKAAATGPVTLEILDSDGKIAETSEENNTRRVSALVAPTVELVVSPEGPVG